MNEYISENINKKLDRKPVLECSCTNLQRLYNKEKKSVAQVAKILKCSQNKVNYWLERCEIPKRSISEAIYNIKNPKGDPFTLRNVEVITNDEKNKNAILFGLGIGLYWGEGLKTGKNGIRLTNTDPKLLLKFMEFLKVFFGINKDQLKFSLQIFDDLYTNDSLEYWTDTLGVNKSQFYKTIISKIRGDGTYRSKSRHGVIIIYFNNVKVKKIIMEMIENIS
jgi:hypothetical protein